MTIKKEATDIETVWPKKITGMAKQNSGKDDDYHSLSKKDYTDLQ